MARLAAYYQEDFHYAPVGTRKAAAAYVLYDRPNLQPPAPPNTTTAVMTLRAPRPRSRASLQRVYEPPECINPYAIARYEADTFDEATYVKRRPYDSFDSYAQPPNGMYESEGDCCGAYAGEVDCILPPVSFRSDSSHGRWQQWPWNSAEGHPMLSPPSPLDSGLSSSQSLTTSSPTSLDSHVCCSCPRVAAYEVASPRYDSGRSSPGAYSAVAYDHRTSRRKSGRSKRPDGDRVVYADPAVRYGMLGIVGEEPRFDRIEYVREECPPPPPQAAYYYIEEDSAPLSPRSAETYDQHAPTVVITEATTDQSSAASPATDEAPKSSSSEGGEEQRRKRTERDIRELEDMYRKCSLSGSDWNDLLERADRREAVHQTRTDQTARTRPLARSKSDTLYESPKYERPHHQRAPPLRRSGVPDIVADDMALRKHSRPAAARPFDPTDRTVTYMLCSSHFTPTVQSGPPDMLLLDGDRPDVEHDDWSYRKHYVGKGGPDLPQPPFGIPIRPPPPRHSDYLRQSVPSSARHTRPLCHPRGNPDVVRDDLAYRTLRKDEPDRLYYEATDVYRKKRG